MLGVKINLRKITHICGVYVPLSYTTKLYPFIHCKWHYYIWSTAIDSHIVLYNCEYIQGYLIQTLLFEFTIKTRRKRNCKFKWFIMALKFQKYVRFQIFWSEIFWRYMLFKLKPIHTKKNSKCKLFKNIAKGHFTKV